MHNRKLISKMWHYYEFPSFVFLGDNEDEETLLQAFKNHMYFNDMLSEVDNVLFMYRMGKPDVLWLETNLSVQKMMSFI